MGSPANAPRRAPLTPLPPHPGAPVVRPHRWKTVRRFVRARAGLFGLGLLLCVIAMAIAAPVLAPYDPTKQEIINRLAPPMWQEGGSSRHVLGTDQLGRDVLSRIIWGARVSLGIGTLAVAISTTAGLVLGAIGGYAGGWADNVIMRAADIQLAFPFILLAIAALGVLGVTYVNVVIVLAVSGWVIFARIVRSETLSLRERDYVQAARAIGASHARIVRQHILPNLTPTAIVLATLELGRVIILESGLSFLGLGIPPPATTWGNMLAEGRNYVRDAWWLSSFAGLALMLVVLAINLVGDALRDALDPSLKID